VFAIGRCMYNYVACAPDDPRLLALIALVAPVEVRPAAPAPHPPSPATRPQSIVRYAGSFCPPQALATAVATEVHPLAAHRRNVPCGTFQQQPHCRARPRNDACMDRFDVAVAWVAQKHFPSCSLTAAAWCTRGPVEAASLPRFAQHTATRGGLHGSVHTPHAAIFSPRAILPGFAVSPSVSVLAGRGRRGQPAAAQGGARALRPPSLTGYTWKHCRGCMGTHRVLTAYSRGLPPSGGTHGQYTVSDALPSEERAWPQSGPARARVRG
jgi:hypothetical protein